MHCIVRYILATTITALLVFTEASAQTLLGKTVSIQVNRKPLKTVLQSISKQGNFYFSYNSNIINEDSLVTISMSRKTVKEVLDKLFGETINYKEKDKYIILQRAEQYWNVSGYIIDEMTNEGIGYASVYEKQQLVASMTNDQGYFNLRVKDKSQPAVIYISKAWYTDTAITVRADQNQDIKLKIKPKDMLLDSVVVKPEIEQNWLGKFFLSSKQRMQGMNLNLDKYFVDKPYQASIVPGFSTHGKAGSQVVNKFSFNLIGGYTAGVNGFELAGMFNIVKQDMRYAQVAGIFNIIGGNVDGAQIGGLYNQALGSVDGVQVGGLCNFVKNDVAGTQISGLYSHTSTSMDGAQISGLVSFANDTADGSQISGLANVAGKRMNGTQIAGLTNISGRETNGVQIASLLNYTKKLDGVQIGFINIADTSTGYSIGFLNIVLKGYHKLSLSTNEVLHFNAAFKSGTKNLHSILFGGLNLDPDKKAFSFGYGVGSEMTLIKRLSISPEASAQYLYLGDWDHLNLLSKLTLNLNFRITKYLSVYAGPSINIYYSNAGSVINEGYQYLVPRRGYSVYTFDDPHVTGWFGWNAGINLF
jgi:hypothetical protein